MQQTKSGKSMPAGSVQPSQLSSLGLADIASSAGPAKQLASTPSSRRQSRAPPSESDASEDDDDSNKVDASVHFRPTFNLFGSPGVACTLIHPSRCGHLVAGKDYLGADVIVPCSNSTITDDGAFNSCETCYDAKNPTQLAGTMIFLQVSAVGEVPISAVLPTAAFEGMDHELRTQLASSGHINPEACTHFESGISVDPVSGCDSATFLAAGVAIATAAFTLLSRHCAPEHLAHWRFSGPNTRRLLAGKAADLQPLFSSRRQASRNGGGFKSATRSATKSATKGDGTKAKAGGGSRTAEEPALFLSSIRPVDRMSDEESNKDDETREEYESSKGEESAEDESSGSDAEEELELVPATKKDVLEGRHLYTVRKIADEFFEPCNVLPPGKKTSRLRLALDKDGSEVWRRLKNIMVVKSAVGIESGLPPAPHVASTKSENELAMERDLQRMKDNVMELSAAHVKATREQEARHVRAIDNEREERRRATEAAATQVRRPYALPSRENVYAFCPDRITKNPNQPLVIWDQALCEVTEPSVAATCSSVGSVLRDVARVDVPSGGGQAWAAGHLPILHEGVAVRGTEQHPQADVSVVSWVPRREGPVGSSNAPHPRFIAQSSCTDQAFQRWRRHLCHRLSAQLQRVDRRGEQGVKEGCHGEPAGACAEDGVLQHMVPALRQT